MSGLTNTSNIKFEYAVGANVIICSFKGDDLNTLNVSNIAVSYTVNEELKNILLILDVNWYINSAMLYIKDLPAETEIKFTPYVYDINYNKWLLCDEITVTTEKYGNISYTVVSDNSNGDLNTIMAKVCKYFNEMGCYSDDSKVNNIPVIYDTSVLTANACYFGLYLNVNSVNYYGRVRSSGGVYATINTFFHELRHRYGITDFRVSHIKHETSNRYRLCFGPVSDDFSAVHNALKFETAREDARLFIADAHSNAMEGSVYSDSTSDNCYHAANMIKALIYYTNHTTSEENVSNTRIIPEVNLINLGISYGVSNLSTIKKVYNSCINFIKKMF